MLGRDQLTQLAGATRWPTVSIFLPARPPEQDSRQGAIRLKNALAAVGEQLLGAGRRRSEVDALLATAQALQEDDGFWRMERAALAIFLAEDLQQVHRVPIELPDLAVVAPQPHLAPLLPLLAQDERFLVLTLTADAAHLHRATPFGLAEAAVELPQSVAANAARTDYENTQHAAPPARPRQPAPVGMVKSHTFGEGPAELRKSLLIQHLHDVASALEGALSGDATPIILVAQPEIQGHFRAVAGKLALEETGLQSDPDSLNADDLHMQALEIARPILQREHDAAVAGFRSHRQSGDGRAATDLATVVGAARFGRVATLLVRTGVAVWGAHDADADRVVVEPDSTPANYDLVGYAALQTLQQGGRVHRVDARELDGDWPLAAVLRY